MADGLVVVSGPGGVGKGTVVAGLRQVMPEVVVSVSATTRAPRPGEVDGTDYHYLTDEQFRDLIAARGFLEWAEFGGHRYGTPWSSVDAALAAGRLVLLEIDVQGALQVKDRHPSATLVFIAPPDPEVLRERLRRRGTDSPTRIAERLAIAEREMAAIDEFDEVVVNDEVDAAVEQLARILQKERR